MPQGSDHLERARIAQWILAVSGLAIIVMSLNAKWALENSPALILMIVALAFVDLGVFGYFLAYLIFHLRHAILKERHVSRPTGQTKLLLGIILVFTLADVVYAPITH